MQHARRTTAAGSARPATARQAGSVAATSCGPSLPLPLPHQLASHLLNHALSPLLPPVLHQGQPHRHAADDLLMLQQGQKRRRCGGEGNGAAECGWLPSPTIGQWPQHPPATSRQTAPSTPRPQAAPTHLRLVCVRQQLCRLLGAAARIQQAQAEPCRLARHGTQGRPERAGMISGLAPNCRMGPCGHAGSRSACPVVNVQM